VAVRALNPDLTVVAPARDWRMTRSEEMAYAQARGIPIPVTAGRPYSVDVNLWGRSIECGVLEDAWTEPPDEVYSLTAPPTACPDEPAYIEIAFEAGIPVSINGVVMTIVDLVASLTTIAGAHGVGRVDMVENRVVGIKSREIYEAPAALVLHLAHRELSKLVMSKDLDRFSRVISAQYADVVYNGLWFTPLREALDAFVNRVQERATGLIRLKLFKGACHVVGRKSPFALYDPQLATYEAGDTFDHAAAAGFIEIFGLPVALAARKTPGSSRASQ
jgi:argininosuccinate synthase